MVPSLHVDTLVNSKVMVLWFDGIQSTLCAYLVLIASICMMLLFLINIFLVNEYHRVLP